MDMKDPDHPALLQPTSTPRIDRLFSDFLSVELEQARHAGQIGFMARSLVLATLPHRRLSDSAFTRSNGSLRLTIHADPLTGLPYGSIPRLLLSWVTTEAVRTKSRHLILGKSLSTFMAKLDVVPTGGRWGTIGRLKNQMERLFSCTISCRYADTEIRAGQNLTPVSKYFLWWSPKSPEQSSFWESYIDLTEEFAREAQDHPIPFSLLALRFLRQSPLALDIYLWATYRNSYSIKTSNIPWQALQIQFGSGYPMTSQGKKNFRAHFLLALHRVAAVYPDARKLYSGGDCLVFPPGRPDVPKSNELR